MGHGFVYHLLRYKMLEYFRYVSGWYMQGDLFRSLPTTFHHLPCVNTISMAGTSHAFFFLRWFPCSSPSCAFPFGASWMAPPPACALDNGLCELPQTLLLAAPLSKRLCLGSSSIPCGVEGVSHRSTHAQTYPLRPTLSLSLARCGPSAWAPSASMLLSGIQKQQAISRSVQSTPKHS